MEIGAFALFFVLGMSMVLLVRSLVNWLGGGGGSAGLPIRDGVVRMDHLGKEIPGRTQDASSREEELSVEAAEPSELAAEDDSAPSRASRSRARRRKR